MQRRVFSLAANFDLISSYYGHYVIRCNIHYDLIFFYSNFLKSFENQIQTFLSGVTWEISDGCLIASPLFLLSSIDEFQIAIANQTWNLFIYNDSLGERS